jgi:hypothetical protein
VPADWMESKAWLQWEGPRNYIAGEASYEKALQAITGPVCDDGYCRPTVVRFIREPQNRYDANAFRAEVQGRRIGYLRRHVAAQMAPPLDRARLAAFEVPGLLRGGSKGAPNIGCHVWLGRCVSPAGLALELPDTDAEWEVGWPLAAWEHGR